MRTMVGKIASVDGVAEVIDARGQHRALVAGDLLREGDRLVTGHGAAVTVETIVGGMVEVRESQTVTMSAQLAANFMADSSDDAVNPRLLQHVLAAIRSGDDAQDLSALLGSLQAEDTFSAFAMSGNEESEVDVALNIQDLILDSAPAVSQLASLTDHQVVDLMASTSLPSEVALQQGLLKDYLKDS
jgi:hypothetical protein